MALGGFLRPSASVSMSARWREIRVPPEGRCESGTSDSAWSPWRRAGHAKARVIAAVTAAVSRAALRSAARLQILFGSLRG